MADDHHIPPTKACKKCGEHKPLTSEFWTPQKLGKYGFTSRCKTCQNARMAEARERPDQMARQQAWRDANKEYVRRYNQAYRDAGYKSTEHVSAWRAANLDYAREREAKYMRERRARDPAFRLLHRVRARLNLMLNGKGGRRTEDLLGYTMRELRAHIERQFTKGMSWERVASGEIHIDHIVPVAAFQITSYDDPDFRACWALANLRPMWAKENIAKGAKRLTLL